MVPDDQTKKKHCAIVYPVTWPTRETAHSTLIYLGRVGGLYDDEVNLEEGRREQFQGVLDNLLPEFPDRIPVGPRSQMQSTFGPDDAPVQVYEIWNPTLQYYRDKISVELVTKLYFRSPSEYGYNPHIRVKEDEVWPEGVMVMLQKPELWWWDKWV